MAAIGWENDGSRIDRAGLRFEFSEEKLVEAFESAGSFKEIGRIHAVFLDERLDAAGRSGVRHAFPIPFGKPMALHEGVEGKFSERVFIGPTQERFAIYLLGFVLLGMAVKVSDRFHVGRKPFVDMKVKEL